MSKKEIYKFTPNAWAFYCLPIFFVSTAFVAISSTGLTFVNIFCLILILILSIVCILSVKNILPTIVIDKKENKIRIENKKFAQNKYNTCIPLNNVSHFEIVEKELKGNKYMLGIWRTLYSDGTKIQQLTAVYKNGKRDLVAIRPQFSMINVLKKDFEIKFETKWAKLRYYSYERVCFIVILLILIFFISFIMKKFQIL